MTSEAVGDFAEWPNRSAFVFRQLHFFVSDLDLYQCSLASGHP